MRRETQRMIVFVPCPIPEDGFAGWALQMRRIAGRNIDKVDFRFLFAPEFQPQPQGRRALLRACLAYAFRCRRAILEEKDPVFVVFPCFFLSNVLIAALLPRRIGYLLRVSGSELRRGNPISYHLRLAMIRRARHVIALNTDQYRRLGELGVPQARRHMIPVSVSADMRPPTASEREAARAALELAPNSWAVGVVGLLCERKQQRKLIQAVASLNRPEAVVILCGPESGGSEADANYAGTCRAAADSLGVKIIMTGHQEDVRNILWALDVFALPSVSEGMPNAMLEAMACGLPCVGSDIPGIRNLLFDGEQGHLFDVDNIEGLADALMVANTPLNRFERLAEFRAETVDNKIVELLKCTE